MCWRFDDEHRASFTKNRMVTTSSTSELKLDEHPSEALPLTATAKVPVSTDLKRLPETLAHQSLAHLMNFHARNRTSVDRGTDFSEHAIPSLPDATIQKAGQCR